ncbi:DNA primase [Streptomyces calidiresistens]|uniref:DNA primase n=1 Tax=Streptomyces calidiresistens TaxID=1485586 RepID=A0A7W3XVY5_9ACTN|nr:DNA primase [Streptomyces calidiresistens]
MVGERVWLDVPFAEKDEAKKGGARWDPRAKRWYAPRPGIPALERWAAAPDIPDLLPGEDRTLGHGLFVDLVPSTCWFTNVRSCVAPRDWERLRRMITRRAGMRCEICGAVEDRDARRWLEAHERWVYDHPARRQTLKRLICLCTDCHTVTHFGYAQVRGLEERALAHLTRVTGMDRMTAREHVAAAFEVWEARSRVTWTLDLGILTDAGITLAPPPGAGDRAAIAGETLRAEAGRRRSGGPGR